MKLNQKLLFSFSLVQSIVIAVLVVEVVVRPGSGNESRSAGSQRSDAVEVARLSEQVSQQLEVFKIDLINELEQRTAFSKTTSATRLICDEHIKTSSGHDRVDKSEEASREQGEFAHSDSAITQDIDLFNALLQERRDVGTVDQSQLVQLFRQVSSLSEKNQKEAMQKIAKAINSGDLKTNL